jgi:beta-phosphoglucomutase-like phosphatase (HAD superfamily)
MTEAILFDCDGVLVDTEARANDAMAVLFTKAGFALNGLECRMMFQGLSLSAVAAKLADELDVYIAVTDIEAAVESALSSGVQEVPGASRIVRSALARGLPVGVASSGSLQKMQMTLGADQPAPTVQGPFVQHSLRAPWKASA